MNSPLIIQFISGSDPVHLIQVLSTLDDNTQCSLIVYNKKMIVEKYIKLITIKEALEYINERRYIPKTD